MTVWVWDQQDTEMESKRNGIIDFAPGMSDNIINGLSGQQPSGSLLSYGQCLSWPGSFKFLNFFLAIIKSSFLIQNLT